MIKNVLKSFLLLIFAFTCQTFGQTPPNMVLQGKVIPFDAKYTRPASDQFRNLILSDIRTTIDGLVAKGVTKLAQIDLLQFKKQLSEIKFYVVGEGASVLGVGVFSVRLGSVYIAETKSIYINLETFEKNSGQGQKLFLHESLGALGYNDQNCEISCPLQSKNVRSISEKFETINLDLSKKATQSPQINYDKIRNTLLKSSGGTTVIGGGGDEIMIAAKIYMLDHFDEWKMNYLPQLLKNEEFRKILPAKELDLVDHLTEEALDGYLAYFTQTPFEPFTKKDGLISKRVTSENEISKIVGIFNNEYATAFIRLSRDHWNLPLLEYDIATSQRLLSITIHTFLLAEYLKLRANP